MMRYFMTYPVTDHLRNMFMIVFSCISVSATNRGDSREHVRVSAHSLDSEKASNLGLALASYMPTLAVYTTI